MKAKNSNQELLTERILKDTGRIPNFIDPKKDLSVWRSIQSILYSVMRLNVNRFLSVQDLITIDEEIGNELFLIEDRVTTNVYSMVIVFVNLKIGEYHTEALSLELYECVANINKYYTII